MATNLGTNDGTTFSSSNMKPESDDQTDALWGQNLADDLMWLLTREQQVINHAALGKEQSGASGGVTDGTLTFKRLIGHDKIYGTIHVNVPLNGAVVHGITVYADGTQIADFNESASIQTSTFNWDVSAKDTAPKIENGELINVVYSITSGNAVSERCDIKGFQAWSYDSLQNQPSL